MILLTGAAGSGKSAFAEQLMAGYAGKKLYLATMRRDGAEAEARIARHKAQRAGKGFHTIECPLTLPDDTVLRGAAALLEDIPNLLANSMFSEGAAYNSLADEILRMDKACKALICVSGDLFSDGVRYDADTDKYLRELGKLCCALAKEADAVAELNCGIPEWIKGEALC